MFVYDGRVDDLPNALLVSAGKEYQIIGTEGEVRGRPRKGVEELGGLRHFIVGLDGRTRRALFTGFSIMETKLEAELGTGNTYEEFLGNASQHLLVTLWRLSMFCSKLNFEACFLECCIRDGSLCELLGVKHQICSFCEGSCL